MSRPVTASAASVQRARPQSADTPLLSDVRVSVHYGFLAEKEFLILDRDSKFSLVFRTLLKDAGVEVVRLPYRSPNLNAYAERFVRSIKDECLSRMIFFGERSLRKATREFAVHYHSERNHQGIDNRLIEPDYHPKSTSSVIECAQRLGGMLRCKAAIDCERWLEAESN